MPDQGLRAHGRSRREQGGDAADRPDSKFARWVRGYGVKKLAEAMTNRGSATRVSFGAVYQWLRCEHEPRGPKARLIVKLSEGALTLEDVAAHFDKRP